MSLFIAMKTGERNQNWETKRKREKEQGRKKEREREKERKIDRQKDKDIDGMSDGKNQKLFEEFHNCCKIM